MAIVEPLTSSTGLATWVSAVWFLLCFNAGRDAVLVPERGWGRFAAPHAWITCVVVTAASVGLGVYGLLLSGSPISLIFMAPLLATVWGVRQGWLHGHVVERDGSRWRADYAKLASVHIAAHVVIVVIYRVGISEGMPTVWQAVTDPTDVMGLAFHGSLFGLGQLSTALAFRSVKKAFAEDWRGSGGVQLDRARQFRLAAAPLVICLIPSLLAHALLCSVLLSLGGLLKRWWRGEPIAPQVGVVEKLVRRAKRVLGIGADD